MAEEQNQPADENKQSLMETYVEDTAGLEEREPEIMSEEESDMASEYIARRLKGENVPLAETPDIFLPPPTLQEMSPEQQAELYAGIQQTVDDRNAMMRLSADPEAIKRLMTDEERIAQEQWERQQAERDGRYQENFENRKNSLQDMAVMGGMAEGDITSAAENVAVTSQNWVTTLQQRQQEYTNAPADPNNITGYIRSGEMLQEAQELAQQARDYADAMKERPENPMSPAPDRNRLMQFQQDMTSGKLPPIDETANKASIEKGAKTVGEIVASGNGFTEAMNVAQGDQTLLRDRLETAYRTLGENAFDHAWSEMHGDRTVDAEYKKQFVDAFVEHKKSSMDMLEKMPKAEAQRMLSDLAVLSENPAAITDSLKGTRNGQPLLTDEKYASMDKYRLPPASLALDMATEITLDIDATRLRTVHTARMSGAEYQEAENVAGSAVMQVIGGDTPTQVIAQTREQYPPMPRTTGNPYSDRFGKAADVMILAERINETGMPLTMDSVRDENHPDYKTYMSGMRESYRVMRADKMEMIMLRERGEYQHKTDPQLADHVEGQAEEMLSNASRRLIAKAETSLAKQFGSNHAQDMEKYLVSQRPDGAMEDESVQSSMDRIAHAKQTYAAVKAINADPALQEIALAAMQSAPEGSNRAEYALNAVNEARDKSPEERRQMAGKMLAQNADRNKDGKIDQDEALTHAAERLVGSKKLDADGNGHVSVAEAKQGLMAKFDQNKDGTLDRMESQEFERAMGGKDGIFAQVMKENGTQIAQIGKALRHQVSGMQDVQIAQDESGNLVEKQGVAAVPNKQPQQQTTRGS